MELGRRVPAMLAVGFSLACGSSDSVSPHAAPATLTIVAGATQTDTVAQLLANHLDVQVRDANGDPVPGVLVSFALASDAGTLSTPSSRTRPSGRTSTAWTLPDKVGTYSVIASVDGLAPVTFKATAIPSYPARLRRVSGDSQVGIEGQSLDEVVVVRVTDLFGNGVEGMTVSFTLAPGNGSALNPQSKSDSLGQAASLWVLGQGAGPKRMQAKAPNLMPILMNATALPAGP